MKAVDSIFQLLPAFESCGSSVKTVDRLSQLPKLATACQSCQSSQRCWQLVSKLSQTLMCLNQTLSRYQTNSTNLAFKVELGKSYLQHGQASSQPPWLGQNHILRRASSFLCKPSPRLSFNGNHPSKSNSSSSAPPSWTSAQPSWTRHPNNHLV